MDLFNNLGLKQVIIYMAIFSVAYIVSGIISPAVSDMTVADIWSGLGNLVSSASASR